MGGHGLAPIVELCLHAFHGRRPHIARRGRATGLGSDGMTAGTPRDRRKRGRRRHGKHLTTPWRRTDQTHIHDLLDKVAIVTAEIGEFATP